MEIDHDWLNVHAGSNYAESVAVLAAWGLPHDLARDIVLRAYWLNSDAICQQHCCGYDCCHVLGYNDVFD